MVYILGMWNSKGVGRVRILQAKVKILMYAYVICYSLKNCPTFTVGKALYQMLDTLLLE
jgi:hypothetical protein